MSYKTKEIPTWLVFVCIVCIICISVSMMFGLIGFYLGLRNSLGRTPVAPGGVACTMEAKICPDGSAVGRQGPNCEFAPCP